MFNISRLALISTLGLLGIAACGQQSAPADQHDESDTRPTQSVSINVVTVEPKKLQSWVYSQGTARSRQREFLTFTQQGMVTHVDESLRIGSPVKAGQVIAHQAPERFTADLQAAKAALAEAEANLSLAQVTMKRYETLIEQRSASQQEQDEAVVQIQRAQAMRDNARAQVAQAQISVDESRLISPINGVLARLNIEKGRYFMPSTVQTNTEQSALRTVPALVIDPDHFEVRVDLPAYDFRQIEIDAQVAIGDNPPGDAQNLDPAGAQAHVRGQVHAISPSLDPETRTFEVIVHAGGTRHNLQDGEFVAVWIASPSAKDVLAVPLDALRFRNDQAFVFVADVEQNSVSERRVELGQQSGNYRAVLSGLEAGEQVVTEGRAALHDGQSVRILSNEQDQP